MRANEFPAQDLRSNCNEAHYYSEVFHRIIEALKRDQSESLEKFQNLFENFQTALTEGLKGQSEKFSDGLESF